MFIQRVGLNIILGLSLSCFSTLAFGLDFEREIQAQNELSSSLVSSLHNPGQARDASVNETDKLKIRLVAKNRTAILNYDKPSED